MNDRQMMVLQIQQLTFMLVELNLFLDTHPQDVMALGQYNALHEQFHALMEQYNMMHGPLMNFGHAPGGMDRFEWVDDPWPWEKDANPTLMCGGGK